MILSHLKEGQGALCVVCGLERGGEGKRVVGRGKRKGRGRAGGGREGKKKTERGGEGKGRGVRSKCYLLTILNMHLAYNALYLVTFCLCSNRENGKDIKDDNMIVTNIKCKTIICVNHNWMVPYHRVIPCRKWLTWVTLATPRNMCC